MRYFSILLCVSQLAQAAETCNPSFLSAAQSSITKISGICGSIGRLTPSNCQRALQENCKRQNNSITDIKTEVCTQIATDSQNISSQNFSSAVTGQNTSQDANTLLNNDATASSNTLNTLLEMRASTVKQMMQTNLDLMSDQGCIKSTAARSYLAATQDLNSNLNKFKGALDSLKTEKQAESKNSTAAAQNSAANSESLKSKNKFAKDKNDSSGISPLGVAAGLGALGGAALLFSNLNPVGGNVMDIPAPEGAAPEKYDGNSDELFTKYGILVDPSFKDSEKSAIAKAVTYIPECHREKLNGMKIKNNPNLKWNHSTAAKSAGSCLMGRENGPTLVQINPTCTPSNPIPTGLVVHEFIHKLANDNGGKFYSQYAKTFHGNPDCAVSDYSQKYYKGKNLNEDFAEAGRISLMPNPYGKISGACQEKKIQAAKSILACQ